MNTTDYLREGYRQLEDTSFYQKIPDDITNKISDRIAQQLLKMRSLDLISDKNFEYLNIKNPTEARFYLLPKIHKKDIPGRPICSSINHPTCHISKFVDEHIKQQSKTLAISMYNEKCKSHDLSITMSLDLVLYNSNEIWAIYFIRSIC